MLEESTTCITGLRIDVITNGTETISHIDTERNGAKFAGQTKLSLIDTTDTLIVFCTIDYLVTE